MARSTGKRIARAIAIAVVLILGIGAVVAYEFRTEIRDHFTAVGFQPTSRVEGIQTSIALTASGDRIFLASRPTIGDREQFSTWCADVDHSEEGHVLGCFAQNRIRLFDVTDERLSGVVEVTAAHELLHATYSRLSASEREQLSDELNDAYEALIADDPMLEERMSVYEQLSTTAFANELHSVLGTEVRDLPKALETHYDQWFTDRARIVDWYDSYHSVFTQLTEQANALSAELESLRTDIEQRSAEYDAAVRQFNADAAEFKARNERFEFDGQPELFNQLRSELLARQDALSQTLAGLQADTDRFNELREQLIELNDVSIQLNDVLDSTLPTPTEEPAPSG
ncbi:hypothetical protein [Leucobacter denitrificans]|uniref:Uncharacterized protein n=1 Tax=Leucobacter denitrificans TaxID=683042 RepID=A0A7G9S5P9_9MICO|nr:hypothetical protein [Leucobacter denitrificans]QNN63174.1 hypothetical protein H9L06_02085 [Leucobacter denitrificans]